MKKLLIITVFIASIATACKKENGVEITNYELNRITKIDTPYIQRKIIDTPYLTSKIIDTPYLTLRNLDTPYIALKIIDTPYKTYKYIDTPYKNIVLK